jgi:hypothetical protein
VAQCNNLPHRPPPRFHTARPKPSHDGLVSAFWPKPPRLASRFQLDRHTTTTTTLTPPHHHSPLSSTAVSHGAPKPELLRSDFRFLGPSPLTLVRARSHPPLSPPPFPQHTCTPTHRSGPSFDTSHPKPILRTRISGFLGLSPLNLVHAQSRTPTVTTTISTAPQHLHPSPWTVV